VRESHTISQVRRRRGAHPFERAPHATLLQLAWPVLLALTAEPLTGAVDTAFVARLGATPLAALGVGTTLLSGVFWIFNFLAVGAQTEVAQRLGRGARAQAAGLATLALALAFLAGAVLMALGWAAVPGAVRLMGGAGALYTDAVVYMLTRLWGAPAVVATLAAFGVLRGQQDMQTPLKIALGLNALNILLDMVLIFGLGPLPPMGIRGAALASVVSQWFGALWALRAVARSLGLPGRWQATDVKRLLHIGSDMFLRTGLLTAFLVLTTRAATQGGAEAGAAHQAIRQIWVLSALLLDSFALAGQSLIGHFIGAAQRDPARHVARVVCQWSLGAGFVLALAMALGQRGVAAAMVPPEARALFAAAWPVALGFQPFNALAFATDGIHWGTGDFRYLRNAMLIATLAGGLALWRVNPATPDALTVIWWVTGGWILLRALFGLLRIWPGMGAAPLGRIAPASRLP
jgi:MATE family multidrug resistance protein